MASRYDEFKYLKRDVIMKPVEEINRISDIQLVPEFQKQGRKVTAVRFLIAENPQQSLLKLMMENGFHYVPLISVEFSNQKMAYVIIST
ncbi:MAG: hypothetical protein ACXV8J_12110 [Methylobacter sp.]